MLSSRAPVARAYFWAGAKFMTTAGVDSGTCKNWQSFLAADTGVLGQIGNSDASLFFGATTSSPCAQTAPVVCLQI